jgi:UDP-3-O-[3-hydroxymyristoyl] glucosamine N-acyltransferase
MSKFTAKQIAGLIDGTIEGDPNAIVTKLSKIEEGDFQSISFLANTIYNHYLYDTNASIVIVANDLILEKKVKPSCTLIRVADPRAAFGLLLEAYNQIKDDKIGVEQPCFISSTATIGDSGYVGAFSYISDKVVIGKGVKIHPNCFIGNNVVIGDNSILLAGVKIHSDCVIGKNCTFHSGVVIGGDGFGFAPNTKNNYKKIPQIGNVIIEDYVEIGSNTTIDRATLGSTILRKGVKLDNLIQIGHNVEIGENTVIVAQTGIAGSTKIGKNCIIAGQVGIVGHITLADGVRVAAQSGVGHSISVENETVQGSPAFKIGDYKRSYVVFRNLPAINDDLKNLKQLINKLHKE